MIFLSFETFSYFAKSLFALSLIKSQSTSNEYFYLISFLSNSSATLVMRFLISSNSATFSASSFSKSVTRSIFFSRFLCPSLTYSSRFWIRSIKLLLSLSSSSFAFFCSFRVICSYSISLVSVTCLSRFSYVLIGEWRLAGSASLFCIVTIYFS